MDTAISVIVLIIVICSIISRFTKKKTVQEQKPNNRSGKLPNQPAWSEPPVSAAKSSAVQSSEGEGSLNRAGEEGSPISGEGRSQEQVRIKPVKVSSEGVSAYPIKKPIELETEGEPVIAIRELFEHDNLVKGVIITEVLGKPKALR